MGEDFRDGQLIGQWWRHESTLITVTMFHKAGECHTFLTTSLSRMEPKETTPGHKERGPDSPGPPQCSPARKWMD